jgi:predicted transcriptional regulator
MGIFGFLSQSHIKHEAGSYGHLAKMDLLNNKIDSIKSNKLSLVEQKKNSNQLKEEDYGLLSRLNDRLKLLDDTVSEVRQKGGFSVSKKLQELSEAQIVERNNISQQKNDIQARLEAYRAKIEVEIFPSLTKLEEELLSLNLDRSTIESQIKQLESEVGPIKYIAEIVSDFGGPEVDTSKAVRIVILILISVFDPLAILLVVSASITFKNYKEENTPKDVLEIRSKLIGDLELHILDGKPVESFIEKYQL